MNIPIWLSAFFQLLVVLPAAASCYLPATNQMKYSALKTTLMVGAVLLPYCFFGAWLHVSLGIAVNTILFPALLVFFFLYLPTVTLDFSKALAIYVGVCAVQTFPGMFAYALDAHLNPASGAAQLSVEAALFQLAFACLIPIPFIYPTQKWFTWIVDYMNIPKIWYSITALSCVFLAFNIFAVPKSYRTLHAGRMFYLFLLFELCTLLLLVTIYVVFYRGAMMILEHASLKERAQLLEMQSHQYRTLQEHMSMTARLRHDFRHSVYLLSSLAEKGDLDSIRTHLAEYESRFAEAAPANYCSNAALNALFGYYQEMAASMQIDMDWNIMLPNPLTVSELDMAGLFGNIIENAIAGCLGVPEGKRYFYLTAKMQHQNSLYIVSTNSFDGNVRKGKDGYHSTKHSGKGTGLVSIAAIAEKYRGTAKASNSEDEFFVDVILKM